MGLPLLPLAWGANAIEDTGANVRLLQREYDRWRAGQPVSQAVHEFASGVQLNPFDLSTTPPDTNTQPPQQ